MLHSLFFLFGNSVTLSFYLLGKGGYVFGSIGFSVTSLAKEVMFLVVLVCLFVSLSVCGQHYLKSYKWIGMKFYGGVLGSKMKN